MATAQERRNWHHRGLARRLQQARPNFTTWQRVLATQAAGLVRAMHLHLTHTRQNTARLGSHLTHLNPEAVLQRGYSIVQNEHGDIVHGSDQIRIDESLSVRLARGSALVKVTDKST